MTPTRIRRRKKTNSTSPETLVALGLGANLRDVEATLLSAIESLRRWLGSLRVAPPYRSSPLSDIPQPDYLNTAVLGFTNLLPEDLLALAKALELAAGRHPGTRDSPRPLDIDLLLYGNRILAGPELVLPHSRLRRRRFVLAPLADLAPDLEVPPTGTTVAELLAELGEGQCVERLRWTRGSVPGRGNQ
jgi:2-amino-4-hydroxy-6-hydroxymethyldihydropteridine diphosphokinase